MRSILLAFLTLSAYGQYFPLHVGDQWVYRSTEGVTTEMRTAEILSSERIGDREYFLYRGIFGDQSRIRLTDENRLVRLADDGSERLIADFDANAGTTYATPGIQCTAQATVESRDASVPVDDIWLENGLSVKYSPGPCADAGLIQDIFIPGLGLAERTYQTIAGPRRFRILFARVGQMIVVGGGQYNFQIHIDRPIYTAPVQLNLRLALGNLTDKPLKLVFPSSQMYDFTIRNAAGESVYTWSANKLFLAVLQQEEVQGERNWFVSERLDLRPGEYVVEAWLTTEGKSPKYKAQLPFTVVEP